MNQLTNIYRDQIIEIVQRVQFLKNLTYPELCRLVDLRTHLFVYMADEFLIREGDIDSSLFILLSGEVGVYKDGVRVSTIQTGDCFGEISFVTGAPRTADVIAHDKVIVIRLNSSTYERLSSDIREKIKDSILLKLVNRIENMNSQHVTTTRSYSDEQVPAYS